MAGTKEVHIKGSLGKQQKFLYKISCPSMISLRVTLEIIETYRFATSFERPALVGYTAKTF